MSKIFSVIISAVIVICFCSVCTVSAGAVSLSATSAKLVVGEERLLTVNGAKASSVVWSSSDTSVAAVDNGIVKGVSNGTATVTAKYSSKKYTCKVTVSTYRIERSSSKVMVGNRLQLGLVGWSGERTWSSADETIATVSENGMVRGVSEGKTKISVTFNKKRLSFTVTVSALSVPVTASKVAYVKFTPSSDSTAEYSKTKCVYITDSEKINELVNYVKSLDYEFVETSVADKMATEAYQLAAKTNGTSVSADVLTFYNSKGVETARYETSLYNALKSNASGILNTLYYSQKCYVTKGDSGIINKLFGWLTYDELVEAAEARFASDYAGYEAYKISDFKYVNKANLGDEIKTDNGFAVMVSFYDSAKDTYITLYLNPSDGSTAGTTDILSDD